MLFSADKVLSGQHLRHVRILPNSESDHQDGTRSKKAQGRPKSRYVPAKISISNFNQRRFAPTRGDLDLICTDSCSTTRRIFEQYGYNIPLSVEPVPARERMEQGCRVKTAFSFSFLHFYCLPRVCLKSVAIVDASILLSSVLCRAQWRL